MRRYRAYQIGGVIAAVLLLFAPKYFPIILVHQFVEIFIVALFAVSFNLLLGYSGMLPFGHAALFGVGAYSSALIFNHFPQSPLLLSVLIGALSALAAGVIIGFFCVRLSGAYFSLASLSFQMFLYAVALKWRSLTRGDDGMSVTRPDLHLPFIGSLPMGDIYNLYYLALVISALGILACYFFLKTPLGNSVVCIRENDTRASFLGIKVFLVKLVVFSVSAFLAGLAGTLFALFQGFVATACIDMNMSTHILLITVIGGTTQFLGPVLGTIFYLIFQDWLSSITKHWWLFMGIVFVIVVMYLEGGLISLLSWERIRNWISRQGSGNRE
jgi:branched-chain amino acid transport system permease protein